MTYEVYAIKYAENNARTRSGSFIFGRPEDPSHDTPHDMDFFVWVIRNDKHTILVDTGFDSKEGERRGRAITHEPADAVAALGIQPGTIDQVIITHLHFDHAGGLDQFPKAHFHLQEAEMVYATGPCMCHGALQMPFTVDHVCQMVRKVYDGKVTYYDGDAEVAPGITVHKVGGHSRGLQVVRVETDNGPLILASDAAHYYENYETGNPFPLVVDVEDMLDGFNTMKKLAGDRQLVVPGHDPLVRERFPVAFEGTGVDVRRLDMGLK